MKPLQAASTEMPGSRARPAAPAAAAAIGEYEVGRGGAEHHEVDFRGRDAGGLDGPARRMLGQVAGGLAVGGDVAPLDAGASADPLVGGVHIFSRSKLVTIFSGR